MIAHHLTGDMSVSEIVEACGVSFDAADYQHKIVDPEGHTIRVYKETYDPNGKLVHVKEK